jgi:hypothetical protein
LNESSAVLEVLTPPLYKGGKKNVSTCPIGLRLGGSLPDLGLRLGGNDMHPETLLISMYVVVNKYCHLWLILIEQ